MCEAYRNKFFESVRVRGRSECWEWQGSRLPKGYGRFSPEYRVDFLTHRFSWELHTGRRIRAGGVIRHTCDNPPCVNPLHLVLATTAENQDDMARKWRSRSKLTEEQIREIRASSEPYRALAERYGLKSHKTVSNIKQRRIFRHVL